MSISFMDLFPHLQLYVQFPTPLVTTYELHQKARQCFVLRAVFGEKRFHGWIDKLASYDRAHARHVDNKGCVVEKGEDAMEVFEVERRTCPVPLKARLKKKVLNGVCALFHKVLS